MRALESRFETAMALAIEAGALALQMRAGIAPSLKGPQDWVTEADGAVERFLSDRLAAAFPADGFQGEEGGIARGGSLALGGRSDRRHRELHARPAAVLRVDRMPGGPHAPDRRDRRAGAGRNLCRAPRRRRDAERLADPCGGHRCTGPRGRSRWAGRTGGPTRTFWRCVKICWRRAPRCGSVDPARWVWRRSRQGDGRLRRIAHQSVGRRRGVGSALGSRGLRSARSWKATDRAQAIRSSLVHRLWQNASRTNWISRAKSEAHSPLCGRRCAAGGMRFAFKP